MLQAGTHKVKVTSSAIGQSQTGNWQIIVTFEDEHGESINAYLSTSEKALEYTIGKLKTLGYDLDAHDLDTLPLNGGASSPIVGANTVISVIEETYNNKTSLKVDRIGVGGAAPMADSDAKAFAAKLRERLIIARGGKVPPPAAKKEGEDIPF